jgi:putative endonuclease
VADWFVYILRCRDDSLYTGIALDLDRRLEAHGRGTASRYTRSRLPVKLVYQETQPDRGAASRREAALKKLTREQKLYLIRPARTSKRRRSRARARPPQATRRGEP